MNWTITRQELVLFHARHKRMRLVYKHDGEPGGDTQNKAFKDYRYHAQSIIDALDGIFREFPKGAEIGIENNSYSTPSKPQPYKLKIKLPGNLDKRIFLAYLIYWRMCLDYEGWKEGTNPNRIIVDAITKVGEGIHNKGIRADIDFEIDCTDGSPTQKSGESDADYAKRAELGKYSLIHLLSTLPISPRWDLWGVFSKDCGRDTLLSKMKDCASPVYAAQLRYRSEKATQDVRSRKLLGYPASLRACYADSAQDGMVPTFVSEEDYYTYCYDPEDRGSEEGGAVEVKTQNQISLYRTYGLLYDALTLALSTEENPEKGKGESASREAEKKNGEEKVAFYIAYPIKTSLGRLHFWHLWLRPDKNDATLEQLWASWWPLHQRILNWPALHTSLATELEQLDIAYAQGEILSDIIKSNEEGIAFSADKSVCEHAYMLFPLDCVCDGTQVWEYRTYQINKIEGDGNRDFFKEARDGLLLLDGINKNDILKEELAATTNDDLLLIFGHKWDKSGNKQRGCEVCETSCGEYKKYKTSSNKDNVILFLAQDKTRKDNLQRQRYRRLIEQQRFLAEQMNLSIEAKEKRAKQELKRVAEELRQLLVSKSPWDSKVLEALTKEGEDYLLLRVDKFGDNEVPDLHGHRLRKAGEIAKCLFGNDNPLQQLRILLSGGLHLYLSSILELNPVKCYSHTGYPNLLTEYPVDSVKEYIDEQMQILVGLSENLSDKDKIKTHICNINNALNEWKNHLASRRRHSYDCCKTFADNVNILRTKHESFTTNSSRGKGNGAALMGTIPLISASDFPFATPDKQRFHLSMSESVVFENKEFSELIGYITGHSSNKNYFVFALCQKDGELEQWEYAVFRNYLSISYTKNGANTDDLTKNMPNYVSTLASYLDEFGGKIFVAIRGNDLINWYQVKNNTSLRVNDIDEIRPVHKKDQWKKLIALQFDVMFLFAFDGYYMKDDGGS